DPSVAAQVQAPNVKLAGAVSFTVAAATALGPLFLSYTTLFRSPPALTLVTPSVLVIERSATRLTVSVSVALLFPGVGSVTPTGAAVVAVLWIEPTSLPATVALTVNVAVPALSRFMLAAMLPLPL